MEGNCSEQNFSFSPLVIDMLKSIQIEIQSVDIPKENNKNLAITALLLIPVKNFIKDDELINDDKGMFFDIGFGLGKDSNNEIAIQPASFGESPKIFSQTSHENVYQIKTVIDNGLIADLEEKYSNNNFAKKFALNEKHKSGY